MPILVSDLDGTLLDVRDRFAHAQATTLAKLGYEVEHQRLRELYRFALDPDQFLKTLNIVLSPVQITQYHRIIDEEFYAKWRYSQLVPGVIPAFQHIRQKIEVMQVITSRSRISETRREFSNFGLNRLFDNVFTRGDLALAEGVREVPLYPFVPHRKRLIQLALKDINLVDDVWVIGDAPGELEAGRSLGCTTIGVLTGFAVQEDLDPFSDYVLNSAAEIDHLI